MSDSGRNKNIPSVFWLHVQYLAITGLHKGTFRIYQESRLPSCVVVTGSQSEFLSDVHFNDGNRDQQIDIIKFYNDA